jgi:small subunit ribosomal protein S36
LSVGPGHRDGATPTGATATAVPERAGLFTNPSCLVWLLTALHAVLLVSYTVLQPTWRAPDEPFHVDLVAALAAGEGYPPYDQRLLDRGILGSLALVRFEEGSRHLLRHEALPREDRPARADLSDAGRDVRLLGGPRGLNHMTQHPPGYYLYMAAGTVVADLLTPGSGLGSYDREVGTMRVLSLVLVLPLPLLAWVTGRAAGASEAASVGAAVVPLGVPQLTHIGSAVNNDALLLLVMAGLTPLAVRFAAGHVTRRGVVAAGVLTGLALLTKAFAVVIPVWLAVALACGIRRRRAWPPVMGGYLAVALVAGGWWWVVNVIRYGSASPSIEYARLQTTGAGAEPDLSEWLADWLPNMSERFWGSFGWVEVPLPGIWTTAATAVVVASVAAALIGRRRPLPGASTAALLLPTVLLAGFVFLGGLRLYRLTAVAAMVQGRYLFGGLVGLSVVVAVGLARLLGRRAALLPALLLLAAAAMQLEAVVTLLDAFWAEEGSGVMESLAAAAAWSPWPPWVLAGMTVVSAIAVVATGVSAVRFAAGAPKTRAVR